MGINWYFPRQKLAKSIASQFIDLNKDRIAMFANRQKGKSEFCVKDLIPEMQERGCFTVYVDFWDSKDDPALAFATGVANAYDNLGLLDKPLTVSSFKLKTPSEALGIKAELGLSVDSPTFSLSAADEAIKHLLKMASKKPVFFVLDEVQHLATKKKFEDFTSKLRSYLINQSGLCKYKTKALFIGSDQSRLADLFKKSKAPFYKATDVIDFPDLDIGFTDYIIENYSALKQGADLESTEAFDLFASGGKMPGDFVSLIQNMITHDRSDLSESAKDFGFFTDAIKHYQEHLKKVNPQDIAILILIARGEPSLYSPKSLSTIAKLAAKDEVDTSSAQGSIRKLEGKGLIITRGHGDWEFSDSMMKEWILSSTQEVGEYLIT